MYAKVQNPLTSSYEVKLASLERSEKILKMHHPSSTVHYSGTNSISFSQTTLGQKLHFFLRLYVRYCCWLLLHCDQIISRHIQKNLLKKKKL